MAENENTCQGCLTYNMNDDIKCLKYYNIFIEDKVCPCSICLIKMMCRVVCKEFVEEFGYECEDFKNL